MVNKCLHQTLACLLEMLITFGCKINHGLGQVEKKNFSVFSHIASPLDLHVEEDGEDHQDPNDDRDPDHLGLILSSCFH